MSEPTDPWHLKWSTVRASKVSPADEAAMQISGERMQDAVADAHLLEYAWMTVLYEMPEGWYLSTLKRRSPGGRWAAAASRVGDENGANRSGFGRTPAAALRALTDRLRELQP